MFLLLIVCLSTFLIPVIRSQDLNNGNEDISTQEFPRGRHGLGDTCNYQTWKRFQSDRHSLFEIIKTLDPKLETEEVNRLISADQERIIAKNYTEICWFHPYLECSPTNVCECAKLAPPFNFVLDDGECMARRGNLCDMEGYFTCLSGLECKPALAGTTICGGKLALEEELRIFLRGNTKPKNIGFRLQSFSLISVVSISIILLILH